ncbi:MAG TPA: tyrosine-type recombinase/integrase [Gemmatimonadales bacterium]|nr:tyrosine-type recombinase/integrase [Gemmatimonadales bacterium]
MNRPFRRKGVRTWTVKVPTLGGGWRNRSTGSENEAVALGIARLLHQLGPRGRRDAQLIRAIHDGSLTLGRLWDASEAGELDQLKRELHDIDLEPLVKDWLVDHSQRVSSDYLDHCRKHVSTLIRPGNRFPTSQFTPKVCRDWLAARPVGNSTKRKYHAALSSFADFLVEREILPTNPMHAVRRPSAAPPRTRYLEHEEVLRLVEAMPGSYRVLSAIMHATGMELSVAIALKRRDINLETGKIHARGTKNRWRDRIVTVESWALPYLREHVRLLTPEAALFPGMNRYTASDLHRKACAETGIEKYQFRDSRHTYAVRMMRAGTPSILIATQLGHANAVLVNKVYGMFHPGHNELNRWHDLAAEMDRTEEVG